MRFGRLSSTMIAILLSLLWLLWGPSAGMAQENDDEPDGSIVPAGDVLEPVTDVVEPVVEPAADAVTDPVVEPVADPVDETVEGPVEDTLVEPVADPVEDAVDETAVEPVAEPVDETVVEPVTDPVAETVVEPVEQTVTDPVQDTVVEPVADTAVDPAIDTVSEPVTDTTSEPVPDIGTDTVESITAPVADTTGDFAAPDLQTPADLHLRSVDSEVESRVLDDDQRSLPTAVIVDPAIALPSRASDLGTSAVAPVRSIVAPITTSLTTLVEPLIDDIVVLTTPATNPVLDIAVPVVDAIAPVAQPVIDRIAPVAQATDDVLAPVTGSIASVLVLVTNPVVDVSEPATNPVIDRGGGDIVQIVNPITDLIAEILEPPTDQLTSIIEPGVGPITEIVGPIEQPLMDIRPPVALEPPTDGGEGTGKPIIEIPPSASPITVGPRPGVIIHAPTVSDTAGPPRELLVDDERDVVETFAASPQGNSTNIATPSIQVNEPATSPAQSGIDPLIEQAHVARGISAHDSKPGRSAAGATSSTPWSAPRGTAVAVPAPGSPRSLIYGFSGSSPPGPDCGSQFTGAFLTTTGVLFSGDASWLVTNSIIPLSRSLGVPVSPD